MVRRLLPLLALLAVAAPAVARSSCADPAPAEVARGRVFVDLDRDGVAAPDEPGVPDVSLSNGCEVVRSSASGRYEIPIAAGQILFLTQPAGYTVPVDANQQPRFYYLHYPEGSVTQHDGAAIEWQWDVIEPTGPLPERIDFALLELPDDGTTFAAHAFADTQAGTELSQDMLREELVNTLLGNPYSVAFTITVGDVVNDNLGLYVRHVEMMGLIGAPAWNLPGNHDINFASPDAALANETYKRHFGPTYYSFEQGNVHFVALNNVEYAGRDGNPEFGNGRYRGYVSEDQLSWLERDLAWVPKDRLVVIATHIPLLTDAPGGGGVPGGDGLNTVNFDRLVEILQPFEHVYGIAGHDTSNSWKQRIDHTHGWRGEPWIAHTLAEVRGNGWTRGPRDPRGVADAMMQDGNPNGFYVLRFDDTRVVPEFVPFPAGPDGGRHLRITLDPLPESAEDSILRGVLLPGTKAVVNLFDGGERDRVYLSVDAAGEVEMRHVLRTDPTFERLYERYRDTEQAFSSPALSGHVWELELPDSLAPGVHLLAVRTVDEFGQERTGKTTFEVLADTAAE